MDSVSSSNSSSNTNTPAQNRENIITIAVLAALTSIYLFLLLSPTQPHLFSRPRNVVIHRDTKVAYAEFYANFKKIRNPSYESWNGITDDWEGRNQSYGGSGYKYGNSKEEEWGKKGEADDFFMDGYKDDMKNNKGGDDRYSFSKSKDKKSTEPNIPSTNFRCKEGWLTIRAEMNYKYLWMHSGEKGYMGASGTLGTPLHRRSYQVIPVNKSCEDGWVLLREGDTKGFLMMVNPTEEHAIDEWTVKSGSSLLNETLLDYTYHFLLEEEGYILNRGSMAFLNVMPEAEYSVRGHNGAFDRTKPASREYGAMMHFSFLNASLVEEAIEKEKIEIDESNEEDKKYIAQIALFPKSKEKRVISFGLFGGMDKYTIGAIKNAQLIETYFPGWITRYYVTTDVPESVITTLKGLGAEIASIPSGMGYSSGMFWRFMIASDSSVDRFIVRDVDSRLNARDRIAVEEWINSKYPVHILRDHVNHCIPMNGGMWGAVKGAIPSMKEQILDWSSRDEYMADLHFLEKRIYPDIKDKHIAHDSYCCDRYPNAKPYPTRRYKTYQHVGQVFDFMDNARINDIDGFIRGTPIPGQCRKRSDWIYG